MSGARRTHANRTCRRTRRSLAESSSKCGSTRRLCTRVVGPRSKSWGQRASRWAGTGPTSAASSWVATWARMRRRCAPLSPTPGRSRCFIYAVLALVRAAVWPKVATSRRAFAYITSARGAQAIGRSSRSALGSANDLLEGLQQPAQVVVATTLAEASMRSLLLLQLLGNRLGLSGGRCFVQVVSRMRSQRSWRMR